MSPNAFAASLLAAMSAVSLHAAELNIELLGLEKAQGQVLVALYDEPTFLKTALKRLRLPAAANGARASFGEVAAGTYAVIAILDENDNGKLDVDGFGAPTEKMGFSNDAIGLFGPPSFAAARFDMGGAAKSVVITLR